MSGHGSRATGPLDPSTLRAAAAQVFTFGFAPWRLSGLVCGALLNDPSTLAAMGDAVFAPPHKAPPRAPVLGFKPRNTLAPAGSAVIVPPDVTQFEIGASLGLVIGRAACRVRASEARDFIAGYTLVADLSVPQDSLYRPGVRQRARDGSCLIGPLVLPAEALTSPDALEIQVSINGQLRQQAGTGVMQRPVARLLQDVTEFMTLAAGDILLLGVAAGAPRAVAGDSFSIDGGVLGRLKGRLVAGPSMEAV